LMFRFGNDLDREVLIFAHLGDRPFTDSIETVGVEGGRVHTLLAPERRKSYLFASGDSLSDRLAVLVHEANQTGTISDLLYLYSPAKKEWHPIIDQEGGVGSGVISPDNLSVAFIRGANGRDSLAGLWLLDVQSKKSTRLISDAPPTHWHSNPAWRPNSKQIGLIELTRYRSLKTRYNSAVRKLERSIIVDRAVPQFDTHRDYLLGALALLQLFDEVCHGHYRLPL
jgi:hypothetical protein